MRRCPGCGFTRAWRLGDGRLKCRRWQRRYRSVTAWDAVQVSAASKRQLLDLFVLGLPVYRQRFRPLASAPTAERFYRIAEACCALVQELRLNHRHEHLYARLYKLLRHTPLDDVRPILVRIFVRDYLG